MIARRVDGFADSWLEGAAQGRETSAVVLGRVLVVFRRQYGNYSEYLNNIAP